MDCSSDSFCRSTQGFDTRREDGKRCEGATGRRCEGPVRRSGGPRGGSARSYRTFDPRTVGPRTGPSDLEPRTGPSHRRPIAPSDRSIVDAPLRIHPPPSCDVPRSRLRGHRPFQHLLPLHGGGGARAVARGRNQHRRPRRQRWLSPGVSGVRLSPPLTFRGRIRRTHPHRVDSRQEPALCLHAHEGRREDCDRDGHGCVRE